MKRNQSGFTLIEIAIVLVIIGLLLGGVLKGQELINSAKVKNLATDFRNIPVYIYGYQDKFRALPGDDIQAISHVSAAANGNGNGLIDGAWDSTSPADESSIVLGRCQTCRSWLPDQRQDQIFCPQTPLAESLVSPVRHDKLH